MKAKPSSFDRVMAIVTPHYQRKMGRETGVMTWLAAGIGMPKQGVTNCKARGRFPTKTIKEISKFTKIPMSEFQPVMTDEVLELSRKMRLSVRDTELMLICVGLDNVNRR